MFRNMSMIVFLSCLFSSQSAPGVTVPFDFEVIASENGFLATGNELFSDMPYAVSGIYPFNTINGGVINLLDLPEEFVVANQILIDVGAMATDLTIAFGSGTQTTGSLEQALQLDGANFFTGFADFANGYANPIPATQPYLPGANSEIELYLHYGDGANEKLLLSGTFDWLDLTVTVDPTDPNLVVISKTSGEMTFASAEPGYEDVYNEILALTGSTGTFQIEIGLLAYSPGFSDPGKFQASGIAKFVPDPFSADFDGDWDVDGADFLLWQQGGSPGPVSAADLVNWQMHIGTTMLPLANTAKVPEPSTWIILSMGMMVMLIGSQSFASRRNFLRQAEPKRLC